MVYISSKKFQRTSSILNYAAVSRTRFESKHQEKKAFYSCSIKTLFSVVFAAALSLPGGNDNHKGTPIYLKRSAFKVFAIYPDDRPLYAFHLYDKHDGSL
jgi:hypothetical protein